MNYLAWSEVNGHPHLHSKALWQGWWIHTKSLLGKKKTFLLIRHGLSCGMQLFAINSACFPAFFYKILFALLTSEKRLYSTLLMTGKVPIYTKNAFYLNLVSSSEKRDSCNFSYLFLSSIFDLCYNFAAQCELDLIHCGINRIYMMYWFRMKNKIYL